jgi:DNA ligase-1
MHGCDYWPGDGLSGWLVSEKLDGWRAYWSGSELLTRQGTRYAAPDWFLAGLPAFPLDCELYAGPGTDHNDVSRLVLSRRWPALTLRPFDIPEPDLPFPDALARLDALATALPAHVIPVAWRPVQSTQEAIGEMLTITTNGGEGIMARNPASCYRPGRTAELVKIKPGKPHLS